MKYRRLRLSCRCGRIARQFADVGITDDGQLVISWRCVRCKYRIYFVKPLSDYLPQCPVDLDTLLDVLDLAPSDDDDDARFLHSLGVRYPDDSDPS